MIPSVSSGKKGGDLAAASEFTPADRNGQHLEATPKLGPGLRLVTAEGMPAGAMVFQWGWDGGRSHLNASRVEMQLWHVDGSALAHVACNEGCNFTGTWNGTQELCDQAVVLAFDLALGSRLSTDSSAFNSAKLVLNTSGEAVSPQVDCRLLQQRQLPAHVGGAREAAPIVVEGLEGLFGALRSEAVDATAAVAVAARARLYGRGLGSSGAVDAADLLRKTSGPWGPPHLILLVPRDPGHSSAVIGGKLASDQHNDADAAGAPAGPAALGVLRFVPALAMVEEGLMEQAARCIQIKTRAERLPAGFAACTTPK